MPKSKRNRTVSLTVTKKKGLEFKQNLITQVREYLDEYESLFIISMFNQRNLFLKELRQDWSDSKFLFGKNKVLSLALGKSPESEYKENLHKIVPYLAGNVGLLFTNKSKEEVLEFFGQFSCPDYARSGNIATEEVTIPSGSLESFQHTMEPQLRKLGLHTSLKKGIVWLEKDHTICKKDEKLNPEQARLLKLFEIMQATFKINVKTYWNKSGDFEILDSSIENGEDEELDEDENGVDENNNKEEEEMVLEEEAPEEPSRKKLKNKNKK